jgi:hypothetical protein
MAVNLFPLISEVTGDQNLLYLFLQIRLPSAQLVKGIFCSDLAWSVLEA